jgi:hypothetical protein
MKEKVIGKWIETEEILYSFCLVLVRLKSIDKFKSEPLHTHKYSRIFIIIMSPLLSHPNSLIANYIYLLIQDKCYKALVLRQITEKYQNFYFALSHNFRKFHISVYSFGRLNDSPCKTCKS